MKLELSSVELALGLKQISASWTGPNDPGGGRRREMLLWVGNSSWVNPWPGHLPWAVPGPCDRSDTRHCLWLLCQGHTSPCGIFECLFFLQVRHRREFSARRIKKFGCSAPVCSVLHDGNIPCQKKIGWKTKSSPKRH